MSVVIPTFNRAQMTLRAVRSVLGQTFRDFEVVVVDDGSTDGLQGALSDLDDPRLKCLRHEQRRGANAARNTGVENASGELVAFLDSDDEWLPQKLAVQMAVLQAHTQRGSDQPLIVVSAGRRDWRPQPLNYEGRWLVHPGNVVKSALLGQREIEPHVNWTTMIAPRVEVLHVGGFDAALPASHWWDMVFRLTERCNFVLGSHPLAVFHDPAGYRVRQTQNIGIAAEILLSKYNLRGSEGRVTRSHLLASAGVYRVSQGHYLKSLSHLTGAFMARPGLNPAFRLGCALFGRTVYFRLQSLFGQRSTGSHTIIARSDSP